MKIKKTDSKILLVEFDGMGHKGNIDIFIGSKEAIKKAPAFDALDENGERLYEDYAEYTNILFELGLEYVEIERSDLI